MIELIPDNNQDNVTRIDGFREQPDHVPAKRTVKNMGTTAEETAPLIEPGTYQMVYVTRSTTYVYKTPQLVIRFLVFDSGEFF